MENECNTLIWEALQMKVFQMKTCLLSESNGFKKWILSIRSDQNRSDFAQFCSLVVFILKMIQKCRALNIYIYINMAIHVYLSTLWVYEAWVLGDSILAFSRWDVLYSASGVFSVHFQSVKTLPKNTALKRARRKKNKGKSICALWQLLDLGLLI